MMPAANTASIRITISTRCFSAKAMMAFMSSAPRLGQSYPPSP